jgi:hypothetical protein
MNSGANQEAEAVGMSAHRKQIVEAVKQYALEHYSDRAGLREGRGWDIVIETMSDEQIAALTGKTATAKAAIARARGFLNLSGPVLAKLPENFYEL